MAVKWKSEFTALDEAKSTWPDSNNFYSGDSTWVFMQEVEVKILEVNRAQLKVVLDRLGAKKAFEGEIETFFFDFENGSIIKAQDLLRLRREESKIQLTYKKVNRTPTAKIAEEYSVEVSDLEKTRQILQFLGLSVTESMKKHRLSYALGSVRFDIDKYEGKYSYIPEFLEIEAENPASVHKHAKLLGFSDMDCLPWSTQDLITHYSSRRE